MTLEKVTNIGITLSTGQTVPVIRAVLSEHTGYLSPSDANDLMLEVYNQAFGCVTGVGAYQQYNFPYVPDIDYFELPIGSFNIGDDTGFKLWTNYYHSGGPTTHTQYFEAKLYYKGDLITTLSPTSANRDFATSFLVIFTDEDYNLLIPGPDYVVHGIKIVGDTKTSVSDYHKNMLICGLFEDEGVYENAQISGFAFHDYSNIKDQITNEINPDPEKDPYDPGGTEGSGPGGGGGNHDLDSDNIDIPSLPSLSAVDTGFVTIFNPSLAQLQTLSDYLWSSAFDIDTIKKLFANPMDAFLGFSIVPVDVPSGGQKVVKVAGVSTGISMTVAARQFVEVDCGSITVNEYWGAYLDYEPFTTAALYLPYIGVHPIAIDDIMGKTVKIVYHVDILSGSCVAYVKCGSSVLYSFIGQCSSNVPMTASDWTNTINGALTIASAIGSMVSSGGASAPSAAGTIASTAVNSLKPSIEKSGSISGTGGMMGIQKPYLIITRPKQAIPTNQNKYMGYPSFITVNLSFLSGFTVMEDVHITGVSATDEEIKEIESLLKEGVIL